MFKNTIEPHLMKSVTLKVHLLQFSCLRYFPSSIIHPLQIVVRRLHPV
uniref:Uncharacterized protein n=1 Tax=Anguilla anguilla TaxID=7936 RepID=A0A0E9QAP8_ANGAN